MALNTKHSYANRLYAHLTAAVTSGATTLSFYPEEITNLLAGWQASSWLYLCIMDPTGDLEIVKMTGLSGYTLTVERGQGGTTARAWAAGSLVASRAVAEYLTRYLQKGVFRSGAYNPNSVLTGEYTGEKFYQTGPDALQRRWWINTTGSKWRLLTGEPFGSEWTDGDGYVYYAPYWVEYSDPSYWTPLNVTWQEAGYWLTDFNTEGSLTVLGDWPAGKEWADLRFQIQVYDDYFLGFGIDGPTDGLAGTYPTYYCYEERPLTWAGTDLQAIHWDARATQVAFKVFVNEGVAWSEFDLSYTEYTTDAYWTSNNAGSSYSAGWTYDAGETYGWDLSVLGDWADDWRPNTIKLTANKACMKYGFIYNTFGNAIGSFGVFPYTETYEEIEIDLCNYEDLDVSNIKINCDPTDGKLTKIEFGEEIWE